MGGRYDAYGRDEKYVHLSKTEATLGRPSCKRVYNIKIYIKEVECGLVSYGSV
jgi:hypothetical protein